MTEPGYRQIRKLSRQTVQLMLEMKSLLRQYDITISVSAPDAYEQLIQASQAIDDDDVADVRRRLIAAGLPGEDNGLPSESMLARGNSKSTSQNNKKILAVHPEVSPEPDRIEPAEPIHKVLYPHAPHEGLLTCDRCQATIAVKVKPLGETQPIPVQCACGMSFRVVLASRQYPRRPCQLPGVYIDQHDETKTGTLVVEKVSFGGVRFRTTSDHSIALNDQVQIQFTLDDEHRTIIWEPVCVSYLDGNTMEAKFVGADKPSQVWPPTWM